MKNKLGFLTVLLFAAFAFSQETYSTWGHYKAITVNTSSNSTGANLASGLGKFPLLVRLTSANSDVFSQALASGADIRFTKSDGTTRLPHQKERFDAVNSVAEFWVLVDTVNAGDSTQSIRMYWGKTGAADSSNGSQVFSTASGFGAVWHLGDSTAADPRPNQVSGAPVATLKGFAGGYAPVTGLIGKADSLTGGVCDAVNNSAGMKPHFDLNTSRNASYAPYNTILAGAFTWSGWYYDSTAASDAGARYFAAGTDSTMPTTGRVILFRANPDSRALNGRYGSTSSNASTAAVLKGRQWQYVTVTKAAGTATPNYYFNGTLDAAGTASVNIADANHPYMVVGRAPCASGSTGDNYLSGMVDELELANANRSASWVKLSFQNQCTSAVASCPASSPVTLGATQNTASVPGAPTTVTDSAGNAQVKVSWIAPASDGGSAITGYTVTSSPGSLTCSTTSSLTCTVNGLTNGTAYTFTVTATNAIGTGAASSPSPSATPTAPPGAPSAPPIGTATAGVGQATITWSAATANGSAVTGYIVTSSPDGKTCSTTSALTCIDTALTAGTSYTFTVVATSVAGNSPPSVASNAVVPTGVPGAPLNPVAKAGNALDTVSWTAPTSNGGSAITGYTATSTPGNLTCTTATLTCVVTGLTKGTSYTFTVKATNAVGAGPASAASNAAIPVSVPGVPGTPTAKAAVSGGADTVSWTAPADSGGAHISAYTVTASDTSKHCTTTGALTCVVSGLTAGTAYTFTVTATNSVGKGAASPASNSVTTALASFFKDADIHFIAGSTSLRLPEFSGVARVSMVDIWGREVWNKTVNSGVREVSWSQNGRSSIVPGIYIVRMTLQDSNHKSLFTSESKILLTP